MRLYTALLLSALACFFAKPLEGGDASKQSPSFEIDVMSVLSKAGCNLGTCHGNLNGKGGLKLSLRGESPETDFQTLVNGVRGRRINLAAPEMSLLLQKATGRATHGGGIRIGDGSPSHQLLVSWIRSGARGPSPETPDLVRLEVEPKSAIIQAPEKSASVKVNAVFSDGSSRDVTSNACYELSNLNAEVDTHGTVTRKKFGETTLIVRYLHLQRPVSMAFIEARPRFEWQTPLPSNAVDIHVFAKLQRLRMNPSQLCSDTEFVRRAFLDAIGRLPTADEARVFVKDTRVDKRTKLIDRLLARTEFADFWALKWADVLRTEEKILDTKGVQVFHQWIRESLSNGRPHDQFVRELLTATGSTFQNPPANFYRANRDASTRGETSARLFLGIRLQCAKCHNHPFDQWTQDDYYAWSSLFSQIEYKIGDSKRVDKLDKNEFAGDQTVLVSKQEEIRNPSSGAVAHPKFLGETELSGVDPASRLQRVAGWIASPDNPLFVQSQVNFIWYQLMGLGIVDPIDDFRLTNPPSNPGLLNLLSRRFSESGFDVRSLVRLIMNSRTYQLSSVPNESNRHDATCFSHAMVRRLPAEVLLDMQGDVLDSPARFLGHPTGIRAVQVPGVQSKLARKRSLENGDRFLKSFGKPDRIMSCDCERSNETTLKQAFMLVGASLNERLADPENRIGRLANSTLSDGEVIDQLYWSILSRRPNDTEYAAALSILHSSGDSEATSWLGLLKSAAENPGNNRRLVALQDIAWALLNAKEFLFRR